MIGHTKLQNARLETATLVVVGVDACVTARGVCVNSDISVSTACLPCYSDTRSQYHDAPTKIDYFIWAQLRWYRPNILPSERCSLAHRATSFSLFQSFSFLIWDHFKNRNRLVVCYLLLTKAQTKCNKFLNIANENNYC